MLLQGIHCQFLSVSKSVDTSHISYRLKAILPKMVQCQPNR